MKAVFKNTKFICKVIHLHLNFFEIPSGWPIFLNAKAVPFLTYLNLFMSRNTVLCSLYCRKPVLILLFIAIVYNLKEYIDCFYPQVFRFPNSLQQLFLFLFKMFLFVFCLCVFVYFVVFFRLFMIVCLW